MHEQQYHQHPIQHQISAQQAQQHLDPDTGSPNALSAQAVMAAQAVNDNWTAAFQRSQHMTASAAFAGAGFAAAGMYGWY